MKERALGAEVLESLNPGQQVVKLVDEELTALMGGAGRELVFASKPPTVILMAGLQGSGKTTAAGSSRATCARSRARTWRWRRATCTAPPPSTSWSRSGAQAGATVYEQGTGRDPVDIAEWALGRARDERRDVLIVDTSGRLHIDEELMEELRTDQEADEAARRPARRRRDDRPGRGERRRSASPRWRTSTA